MPVEGYDIHDVGCAEWGNEIVRAVPYIYYQVVKEGKKKIAVETTEGMRPFYFFLKDAQVKIKYPNRDRLSRAHSQIPWQNLYDDELNYKEWLAPAFKEHFQNQPLILTKKYDSKKPILIVSNKFNHEWTHAGLNAIPIEALEEVFHKCTKNYNVVYNRIHPKYIVPDSDTLAFEAFPDDILLELHPEVIDINDLHRVNNLHGLDVSTMQLRLFSKASRFINVQGGMMHFAAYFGGKQLCYLVRNGGIHTKPQDFLKLQSWHKKLGGAEFRVATTGEIGHNLDWLMS